MDGFLAQEPLSSHPVELIANTRANPVIPSCTQKRMVKDAITPFRIEVPEDVLNDLRQRLERTRWSYQIEGTNWDGGTDVDYLKELVAYWQGTYDWRKQEAALN